MFFRWPTLRQPRGTLIDILNLTARTPTARGCLGNECICGKDYTFASGLSKHLLKKHHTKYDVAIVRIWPAGSIAFQVYGIAFQDPKSENRPCFGSALGVKATSYEYPGR